MKADVSAVFPAADTSLAEISLSLSPFAAPTCPDTWVSMSHLAAALQRGWLESYTSQVKRSTGTHPSQWDFLAPRHSTAPACPAPSCLTTLNSQSQGHLQCWQQWHILLEAFTKAHRNACLYQILSWGKGFF